MKRLPPPFFVLFFCFTQLFSQDLTLSGTVKNTDGTPIEFANVFLLDRDSSTLLKGTTTNENGIFALTGVSKGTFFLKASYIEAASEPILLEITDDRDELSIILDNSQQLDEVVVITQKPRLERKIDRLVFTVENTALADGDIWDVLKRTPNLLIVNDKLTINGSGAVGILINGRKVNIPEKDIINLLSGTSASSVESIEVITNPPAKYSAEGGMLVNIIVKKNLVAGYNGAVYNKYRQGVFARHTLGTDHYFRGAKSAFSMNYSYADNKSITRYTDVTDFSEANGNTSRWVSESDLSRRRRQHNASVFFDYDIDAKNRLSLSTITLFQPKLFSENDSETLLNNTEGDLESSFTTNNSSDAERLNTSLYIDYVHTLKEASELSFNGYVTYYDTSRPQTVATDFFDAQGNLTDVNNFISASEQRINLFSLQTDYNGSLSEKTNIEMGLRYADINSSSFVVQEGFEVGQSGLNPTEQGNFDYDESIWAAYLGINNRLEQWRINAGLRAEYTETVGDLDTAPQANELKYLEFFPSLSVQYLPSKKHDVKLVYYRRITRPRYSTVNPFQIFLTNNSVVEGEPNLLPATRNYVLAEYTYNKRYTLELFYRNEKNPFLQFLRQDNDSKVFVRKTANFDRNINYGVNFSVNLQPTNFWEFYLFASHFSAKYDVPDFDAGGALENRQWTSKLRINNTLGFLQDKTLQAYVDFNYNSAFAVGNAVVAGNSQLNLGVRKTFWDKKASISLGLLDIFNQGNIFTARQLGNQNNTSLARAENRLFTFGFRYKFGNTGIKTNKKSKASNEQKRL